MAQKLESRDERPLQSFTLKNFLAVNTTSSRLALQQNQFYHLENIQPIGGGNMHTIADISAALHDFSGDSIYFDFSVNIGGTEYLIAASTNGKLFAFNVGTNTVTQINGGTTLAGTGLKMAQWQNADVLLVDSTGYYSWNGSGNISASMSGTTGAPTSGVAIAVYQQRVWIAQGRVLYFSAAGSFTDFTSANGGGTTTLTDPVLRSSVQALLAANGYLYIFGVSSINAISDLYVPSGASPPTPTFTNLNISAIVGTDQPNSIFLYGRLVLFANRYGAWSLYGTTVNAISSPDPNNSYQSDIDGTWQYLSFTNPISGGQVISQGLFCGAFLLQRSNDPIFGSNTVIGMYQGNAAGGRWWFANYGSLTRITTTFVNNIPALYGYIGNKLYQLFSLATSSPPAIVMGALWDFQDPVTAKQVIRAGVGLNVYQPGSGLTSVTVDGPNVSYPMTLQGGLGAIVFVNNAGGQVQFQNNSNQIVQFIPAGYGTYWASAPNVFGKFVGMTVKSSQGMVFELDSLLMDYKWAARWVGN